MTLPILNDTPKYELTIPSTGKRVKYRPYLVKEEKILLLAAESKDISQITSAVIETVIACLDGDVDRKKLKTFDVEYIFLQLRGKSVGEKIDLSVTCSNEECNHSNRCSVDVNDVKLPKIDNKNKILDLGENLSLEVDYLSYDSIDFSKDERDVGFATLRNTMQAVVAEDERYDMRDHSDASKDKFIESMNRNQFEKLSKFIENVPSLSYDLKFCCEKCGKENEMEIKGLKHFF